MVRKTAWVSWTILGLSVLCGIAAFLLIAANHGTREAIFRAIAFGALFMAIPAVGALISVRRPENAVGWLLSISGLCGAITLVAQEYDAYSVQQAQLPGWRYASWLGDGMFAGWMLPLLTFCLLLFPTGHLLSRRWLPVAGLAGLSIFCWLLSGLFGAELTRPAPVKLPEIERFVRSVADPLAGPTIILAGLASVASVIVRFRRSSGVERLQLKWFVFAAGFSIAAFVLSGLYQVNAFGLSENWLIDLLSSVGWITAIAGLTVGLPVVIGIAITRHGLYQIDRIINRTLVYGTLSAVLGAAYLGLILMSNSVVTGAAGGDTPDLVIAGATLAVAALFQPLRRRIQLIVDRRFYRHKYDAARTIDIFAARLREEVDLESLEGELRAIVRETMQPSHVSLWLRPVNRT